jgi:predicted peptidase
MQGATPEFDARTNAGYNPKSKGGFMMDIINNPDKYANAIAESKELHKVLNDSKKIQTIPNLENTSAEPQPERDAKQANILLIAVLQDTHADRELRSQVIDAFVRYEITTEDLLSLIRLPDAEARIKAQRLLQHTPVE